MNLWTYTLREAQRRPGRTLLTLLGITLGLAAVVATRLTIHTVDRAYRDLFEGVAGRPALEVIGGGQGGFDPGFVPALQALPGVAAVLPRIQGAAALVSSTGSIPVPLLGIEAVRTARDEWPLRAGRPLAGDEEAWLDAGLADSLALAPDQQLQLWVPSGQAELRLAGVLQPRGASTASGGALVVSLACARRLLGLEQAVNSIQVLLEDDADSAVVQQAIARRLPPGLSVQAPGQRGELGRATLRASEQGLSSLGLVALIAAAFVILNTFLLNLGERRRQVAIMRSLGATRWQMIRLLLRETFLLGLVGTLLGCTAGLGLAFLLLHVMGQFLGMPLPGLQWHAEPFVLAGLLGPGTALAAAWVPAWRAGNRPPLAELVPQRGDTTDSLAHWLWPAGLLLCVLGGGLEIAICRDCLPEQAGRLVLAPALAMLLIGSVLALPLVIGPLLRLIAVLPLGVLGTLAVQQLLRQRTRTSLTAGVLFLALAVAIAFGQCLRGILRDLQHWYSQTIVADFLVRSSMPDSAFLLATALPDALGEEIGRLPGVAAVDRLAFVPGEVNGQPVLVLARTFRAGDALPLDLHEGEAGSVLPAVLKGEVVLGSGLAQHLRLHRGGKCTLATAHGPVEVGVAGTAAEYAGGGLALYLEWDTARRLLDVPGAHVFLVRAGSGGTGALTPTLRTFCGRNRLLLQSNADLRELIGGLLGRVTGALWALMTLAFAVASLGIVNTLTMNVQDQTRDLGVLRALGLKRAQIGRLVLAQALALGGVSLMCGGPAGVALAYVINRSSTVWGGQTITFEVEALLVAGCCVLALTVTLIAALSPARQAARMPVMQAIHH
jgi:putative ABC transport system permease protein